MEVYYYIPSNEADNAVECGLKLSKWFDKEVIINGESRKCLSALLNPRDDIIKYRSPDLRCLKLELPANYCYVADKYLYQVGLNVSKVMELYSNTIIPINEYIFGMYRLPECLVTSTPIPGQVAYLGKGLDSPVLFNSSGELYINNIIEAYKEEYNEFNDCLLYYFYCKLSDAGKVDKIEDGNNQIAVFVDKNSNKTVTLKIPDITKFV